MLIVGVNCGIFMYGTATLLMSVLLGEKHFEEFWNLLLNTYM